MTIDDKAISQDELDRVAEEKKKNDEERERHEEERFTQNFGFRPVVGGSDPTGVDVKTEEQIITILKENEAGSTVVDLARHHGVAENTIYRWKSKYGGMEVSDAKRLRALEAENAKLKRMYADLSLENDALKNLIGKKL